MTKIADQTLQEYLTQVAQKSSTPGGGAVAAVTAAEACALLSMVAHFTEDDLGDLIDRTNKSMTNLLSLAEEDSRAFNLVMAAYKGDGELELALREAAEIPAKIIRICYAHFTDLLLLAERGNRNLISDVAIAASLFSAALESSRFNILINLRSMEGDATDLMREIMNIDQYLEDCHRICDQIREELS